MKLSDWQDMSARVDVHDHEEEMTARPDESPQTFLDRVKRKHPDWHSVSLFINIERKDAK